LFSYSLETSVASDSIVLSERQSLCDYKLLWFLFSLHQRWHRQKNCVATYQYTDIYGTVPLCLFLNKPHLFSPTQRGFIFIQLVAITCFWMYWVPFSGMSTQKPYKGRRNKICTFFCMDFVDFYFIFLCRFL